MYEYSIPEDFDIDKDVDGNTTGFGTNFKVIIVSPALQAEEGRPALSIVDLIRKKAIIHLEKRYQNLLDKMGSEKQ